MEVGIAECRALGSAMDLVPLVAKMPQDRGRDDILTFLGEDETGMHLKTSIENEKTAMIIY